MLARMDERPHENTLEEMYGEGALSHGAVDDLLDETLSPRGPDMLFDLAAELGLSEGDVALDVGCGDGSRTAQLVRRTGCDAVGVDYVMANLRRRHEVLSAEENGVAATRMRFAQGDVQRLPLADGSVDAVWSRDMLIHVPDLVAAFRECRRVLRPGGWMLVFQMFATSWLSEDEAARLFLPLAAIRRNADPAFFEASLGEAGWSIERVEPIRSEWREFLEESDSGRTSRQLLRVARLLRAPDRYVDAMGRAWYEAEVADSLWGVYQMIGKLSARVYVLR
jgi:ubiquinone/menaquinone biosynthesis C-methylase UbiE